jgi:aspartate kinase
MLNAESLTIWKDVVAVMNADPKQFPEARAIAELNYNEVIEMAYYGAQVIHPKTIKPLQNKDIPLLVRCFLDPSLPGTVIHDNPVHHLPPIFVLKENQVLLQMNSRDFSFFGDEHAGRLYQLFESLHIKPNLTQNAAISFLCVFDDKPEKIEKLAAEASAFLDVQLQRGLSLLTIRHFTPQLFDSLSNGKTVLLRQQTLETIQALLQ